MSTASRCFLSTSENFSASCTMRSTSSLPSVEAPVILMSVCRPLPLSVADTDRMPLASMSNLTSICKWREKQCHLQHQSRRMFKNAL